ncbi:hypothetical protein [Kitasatospora sp. NPDC051914]|uniref:hypothetical protein n=1 Tax=Kitasatospora sp. NPDC051914 TaxID=3154945 RepID=UPI003420BA9B
MTSRPNRNEYCKQPVWVRNALLPLMKKREVQLGMRQCANTGGALILQMVRSKNTGRVTMVQYPAAGVSAAYARLVSDEFPAMGEFVAYVIVASAQALELADRRGVPYMTTLRPSGAGRPALLLVPRSLFAENADAEDTNV